VHAYNIFDLTVAYSLVTLNWTSKSKYQLTRCKLLVERNNISIKILMLVVGGRKL